MVKRSTLLFFHWNRKSKTDDRVIIISLAFIPETKMSSDSLCPTLPLTLNITDHTTNYSINLTIVKYPFSTAKIVRLGPGLMTINSSQLTLSMTTG